MLARSATLYQKRKGRYRTQAAPGPRLCLEDNAVHRMPVPPLPELLLGAGQPPDAGLTQPWPHGDVLGDNPHV